MKTLSIKDLGRQAYLPVMKMQEELLAERVSDDIADTLIVVEHDAVYTFGANSNEDYLVASKDELKDKGIEIVRTSRGGEITYHGPGQLVCYPIIKLSGGGREVLEYVKNLEETILSLLATFDVTATTDRKNRGVWVGNEKIAALGVKVTSNVTMHGFALNVTVDLSDYSGIIPCGIQDKGVTSLNKLVAEVSFDETKQRTITAFKKVFGYAEVL